MSTHATRSGVSPLPFWPRQFAPQPTRWQVAFDVAFGIALPAICLYLDPIVFRTSFGRPLLGGYGVVAGVATGTGFLSLAVWLAIGKPTALLAGLLAGGALFASLLGFVLLPFSLMGLFVLIGVLGFSPFVAAFVFWRNAVRAFHLGRQRGSAVIVPAVLGAAIACGGPLAAQLYVTHETSRALEMVLSADPATTREGVAVLKRFHPLTDLDGIVVAYASERNESSRGRLAEAYREVTGRDIEQRLDVLRD